MLRQKQVGIRFYGRDQETGREGVIDVRPFLTGRQATAISRSPDLMVQFAHWLSDELQRMGQGNAEIRATCLTSLNGRRPQLYFDPQINLAAEPRRLGLYPWLNPLTEPLRQDAWNVPLSQWESHPEIAAQISGEENGSDTVKDPVRDATDDCPDVDSNSAVSIEISYPSKLKSLQPAFEPVPVASLVVFRIWFGAMMALDTFWHIRYGWVEQAYIQPRFLFKFYFFEWVHPWPGNGMYLHFGALLLLAGCITLGLFYRLATVLFATGITYVFLLDKAEYLNHVYLTCLISWILVFVPSHCAFSIDALRRPDLRSSTVPAWCLWLVRFSDGSPLFLRGNCQAGS